MRDKCMDVSHQRDHERQVYGLSHQRDHERQVYGRESSERS